MKKLYPDLPSGFILIVAGLFLVIAVGYTFGLATPVAAQQIEDPTETTIEGAVFPLPESLENEVGEYRQQVPQGLAPHASVLATSNNLYIVFTESKLEKGRATVSGRTLERGISAKGLKFGVILADRVSVETAGKRATVTEVAYDPRRYELDLVRIDANHRRISVVNDPDQGQDATAPVSAGVLIENPTTTNNLFLGSNKKARSLVINTSTDALGSSPQQETESLLGTEQPRLFTFDFETHYWSDTQEEVDGIVIRPGSEAYKFATAFDATGILETSSSKPILYVVDAERSSQEYSSIQALKTSAEEGDVVTIDADLHGQSISIQETLEETTGCGQSIAQLPTPSGPTCVDILQDTRIVTGVAWTSASPTRGDTLLVVGFSSDHSDEQQISLNDQYKLSGKVVSLSKINPQLPDEKILILTDAIKTDSSTYSTLPPEYQKIIKNRLMEINSSLHQQNSDSTQIQSTKTPSNGATERIGEDSWPSYRYDPQNTGFVEGAPIIGIGLKTVLTFNSSKESLKSSRLSRAVISEGTLFAGRNGHEIVAIDLSSGEIQWSTVLERGKTMPARSSPAVWDEHVIIEIQGNSSDYVYSLNKNSGEIEWKYPMNALSTRTSPTVSEGTAYIGGDHLSAIDIDTGTLLWRTGASELNKDSVYSISPPAVTDEYVYVTGLYRNYNDDNEGEKVVVAAFNKDSGVLEWQQEFELTFPSTPAVSKNRLVFKTHSRIVALDRHSGTLEWQFEAESTPGSPTISDGRVYVTTYKKLLAIDIQTGKHVWEREQKSGDYTAGPVVLQDSIYTACPHRVCVYNEDGKLVRELSMSPKQILQYNDTLVIVGYKDTIRGIHAFRTVLPHPFGRLAFVLTTTFAGKMSLLSIILFCTSVIYIKIRQSNILSLPMNGVLSELAILINVLLELVVLLLFSAFLSSIIFGFESGLLLINIPVFLSLFLSVVLLPVAYFHPGEFKINLSYLDISSSDTISNDADQDDREPTDADFVILFSCGNCGNSWEYGFNSGDEIRQTDAGVIINMEEETEDELFCPVCDTHHAVTIEDREPTG